MKELPQTVFVVDDDDAVRNSLRMLLKSAGLSTEVAGSAHEFLTRYDTAQPGCLVLDVRMPGMSGIDLLEIIRSYLRWHTLPVAIVTAHGTDEELKRAEELGVCGIFKKAGFKLVHLLECIQKAVPPQSGTGGASHAS